MGRPTEGAFLERPADPHVNRRRALLTGRTLAPPAIPAIEARAATFPGLGAEKLLHELGEDGIAMVQLDGPLANDRFAALGSMLGTALAETNPAVQPYVENKVILNLVNQHGNTDDVNLQPFAANYLTLHSEGSGRPAGEQPRFVVLLCLEPGSANVAQTVLIPMAAVSDALTPRQRAVLAWTRYRGDRRVPWIWREAAGRPVFSFRDFAAETLEWTYGGEHPAPDVNGALRALLAAMYEPTIASGVHWARGMLVVIDNTRFFHGRTAGNRAATRTRHLKRLRILKECP